MIAEKVAVDAGGAVSVVAIDGRIFVHNSVVDSAFGMGIREGRRRSFDEVSAIVKSGDLGGNGCDHTAQNNGVILAGNVLYSNLTK